MLTVFRSNRAETLASLLAVQLRENPPPPLETVQVVVNTWPTSRWLGEQLAVELGGIAANIRYPFPGSLLRRMLEAVLGGEGGERDPWRANDLVWPVLELLPALVDEPAAAPLRRWLQQRGDSGQELGLAQWQLGRCIADALDDYALYRPDLLGLWWEGLEDGSDWQALLVRLLRQKLGVKPFGLRVREAVARLQQHPDTCPELPARLRLFGLSSMAPVQVELLHALSGRMAVEVYLLTPCPDLWQHCRSRRSLLSDAVALRQPLGADWLAQAGGLEARFGRLGAEFQQLLEGTGQGQLGASQQGDLFLDPTSLTSPTGPADPGQPAPLLRQLQRQLVDPASTPELERATRGDRSLEFHACPGRLRQLELVRDRILQLLHDDPSLQPRDVLVMTPQVDAFAPLVASVFGDREATGVALDWRLTDRSQQGQAGLGPSLLALVRQAGERLTASSLQALLESPALRQRFQLSAEEMADLHRNLQRLGFRWGLDGLERGGEACGSLSWAIDRLLLGLVLPETPGLAPAETAPFAAGTSLELLGRWLHLLGRLRHWLERWRRPRSSGAWARSLQAGLEDLFGDAGDAAWELPPLLAAIDDWQRAAAGCELQLAAPVVAAVLEERLAEEAGRFGHRSGALTISALEPMRAIPHRVIVLMGLDGGSFPRQSRRPGFHHLERQRQLGDPSPADQDRYALLEALLSARDHLLITWNCRDERKGEPLQPATPVSQWIAWLESALSPASGPSGLVQEHPANPLERANFLPTAEGPPASCDRRRLAARQLLDRPQPPPLLRALAATAAPESIASSTPPSPSLYEDLRHWLAQPQGSWLESLGLQPKEWSEAIEDLDAAALDERQRSSLLRQALGRGETCPADPADDRLAEAGSWLEAQRGRGLLPPLAGGELEAEGLAQRWRDLTEALETLGPAQQRLASWQSWQQELPWRGSSVVLVHTARAHSRQRLELWLRLLLAAAADQQPSGAVLLARGSKGFGKELELQAPDAEGARAELERLAALRQQWRQRCWPVPPETGWALLLKDEGAAINRWEGSFQVPGERLEPEQALCFGAELPGVVLLEQNPVRELAAELLDPMLERLA